MMHVDHDVRTRGWSKLQTSLYESHCFATYTILPIHFLAFFCQWLHKSSMPQLGKCQTLDSSRDVVLLHAHSKMVMGILSWGCSSTARVIAVATEVGESRALWGQAWAPIVHEKLHMQHTVLYACSVAVAISAVWFAHSHSLLHLSFSSIACGVLCEPLWEQDKTSLCDIHFVWMHTEVTHVFCTSMSAPIWLS